MAYYGLSEFFIFSINKLEKAKLMKYRKCLCFKDYFVPLKFKPFVVIHLFSFTVALTFCENCINPHKQYTLTKLLFSRKLLIFIVLVNRNRGKKDTLTCHIIVSNFLAGFSPAALPA